MTEEEIYTRVQKLVADQLQVDIAKVVPTASFVEDLNADSLDVVEMIMALEEEFKIEIPDTDAEKIRTVGDALSYIKDHSSH